MKVKFQKVRPSYGNNDDIMMAFDGEFEFITSVPRDVSDDVIKWLTKAYEIGVSEGELRAYQAVEQTLRVMTDLDVNAINAAEFHKHPTGVQ